MAVRYWISLVIGIFVLSIACTRDASSGTITIVEDSLQMTLSMSMIHPPRYNFPPLFFYDTYSGSGIDSHQLYGEIYPSDLPQYELPYGDEDVSWFRAYCHFEQDGTSWQTKDVLDINNEYGSGVSYGMSYVIWEMEFIVTGSDINYDFYPVDATISSAGFFSRSQSWIFDLTINKFLVSEGSVYSNFLTDGHQYKAGLRSELCGWPYTAPDDWTATELRFFNAEIIRRAPEPSTMLLLGTGLIGFVATCRDKKKVKCCR